MKKIIGIIVVLVIIGAAIWVVVQKDTQQTDQSADEAVITGDVARVNGEAIDAETYLALESQFTAFMQGFDPEGGQISDEDIKTQVLDSLINQLLLEQASADLRGLVAEEEIESEIATIKQQLGDEVAYTEALAAQGLTEAELREQIKSELAIQMYLDQEAGFSDMTASEEELATLYEQVATEDTPSLEEVRDQLAEIVIQQKQQEAVEALVAALRADADIAILI